MPEIHEAANLFPLDEETIGELAEDIRQRGQMVPIELLDGKVLDGRRRLLACEKAGVEPTFKAVDVADPVAYVLSLNLHRRHLDKSQCSMIGARAREMYDKAAKERQIEAGRTHGRGKVPELVPEPISRGDSRDRAGAAVGVCGPMIDRATRVLRKGTPELISAVDDGKISVSRAETLLELPPDEQREIAADPPMRKRHMGRQANEQTTPTNSTPDQTPKVLGVGVIRAREAINILSRIPKNDALRSSGLKIVADWVRRNK